MARKIVTPAQLDFESPGRRDYWVALEHDTWWAEFHIPLTVLVGPDARPGEGLVAFGSNHGNEYEGPVAIKSLLPRIRTEDVRGRLILVPVLNPAAFRSGTRESVDDDGVNLNRAFVEGAGRTPALAGITHRIAAFVRERIWPNVHIVIDVHSGGTRQNFVLCASFHEVEDPEQAGQIEETARWFATPVIMCYQDRTPGLLPSEAERLGKITIGTEMGWGGSVNPEGVRCAMHGIRAAAINHGQLQGTIEPMGHHAAGNQRKVEIIDPECFVPAPWPGLFEPVLEVGEHVKAGDTVGRLHDFHRIDDDPHPIRARVDGILISRAWNARVIPGLHIAVVGREVG